MTQRSIGEIKTIATKVEHELHGTHTSEETMNQLNDFEKLDFVLNFMLLAKAAPIITHSELWGAISGRLKAIELLQILNYLKNDGLVHEEPRIKNGEEIAYYSLTFKGKMFISEGSYVQQEADRLSSLIEQEGLRTLEKRLKEKVLVQNWWLIAIGSIAAFYYLIEIAKEFYPSQDLTLVLILFVGIIILGLLLRKAMPKIFP